MNTAARHCDLARWWGVPIAGERDLPALKDAFTRRGLDRRAWRLYLGAHSDDRDRSYRRT